VVAGAQTKQLDTSEIGIPRLLKLHKTSRYSSADIGKWHLHLPAPPIQRTYPNVMGYDLYSGNFSGMLPDFYLYPRIRNGVIDTVKTYATTQTVNEAVDWIGSLPTGSSFFCWLAFNAPHTPFHVPPASLCDTKGLSTDTNAIRRNPVPYFKAAVQAMDTEIGRLIAFLKSKGLYENTDIIFIGDNGNASQVAQSVDPKKNKGNLLSLRHPCAAHYHRSFRCASGQNQRGARECYRSVRNNLRVVFTHRMEKVSAVVHGCGCCFSSAIDQRCISLCALMGIQRAVYQARYSCRRQDHPQRAVSVAAL
jgi:arylsulfatase A-like enzyme